MNANELRIGNLLSLCDEVISISSGFIADYDFSKYNNFCENTPIRKDDVKPIPLTEEWLLKFGFNEINGCGYMFFGNQLQKKDGSFWYKINGYLITLQYLHQLQNLYFALTGKELEIKQNQ